MAKKYSVNVENDEVISVEVDGIRYDSPDQIPDAADREKILRLISKSTEEDFGEEFNKEFEADFRELERQSARAPQIITTVFLTVGVLMLVIALISSLSTIRALARERSAPGQVVDMTVRQSRDSDTQVITEYYYPVVEFELPDGTSKRVQLSEGSWPPEYEVGQAVTILYNPSDPLEARIKSFSSAVLSWILPGITGIVGVVFLGVTFVVRNFARSGAED